MTDIINIDSLNEEFSIFSRSSLNFIEKLHRQYQFFQAGNVAADIPELAKANPDWFGISIVGINGQHFDIGDTAELFTIQSISKPFVYGLALEDRGEDYVSKRIGVEPTGESFNSTIEPDEISKKQYNPLVNAGALATTGLIRGANASDRSHRLLEMFRSYIGREVQIDRSTYHTKRTRNHLNRALAYMMLDFGLIEEDIDEILDLYCQQCSLMVSCHDLAVMAATLANNGINPITGERALNSAYVKNILSIMYTCGLYDFSGQWAYKVGIPAKSGLAGAIIGVIPQQMGIAVFSPPLGEHRKSARGVKVFEELSAKFKLHTFQQVSAPQIVTQDNYPPYFSTQNQTNGVDGDSLTECLQRLYEQYLPLNTGRIYTSEPDLAPIDRDWFGISVATTTGQVYSVGNWDIPFLIQSISKVFAYGLALEDWGRDYVLNVVDVEPTGDPYDSIIKLQTQSKRPFNPMVNAGAIATTSLIKGSTSAKRLNRILQMYQRYIGHRVFVDTPTFVSEQSHGDRNWAISYLLRNFGLIKGDIRSLLDLYLQQCSVIINCRDLAVMGATLANGGINPITGSPAIAAEYVRDLLSVMYTCGMYDFAGEWLYKVGFPAKSGVGGGIIAVVPGQMGIAVFSAPLDDRGNSIRGIEVCQELSRRFNLHILD
ncbi:MAG: glutaminase A [Prochloraceae cyanobacterium]|nr:glutaminase A [Prochloraceae cyanobacterium]